MKRLSGFTLVILFCASIGLRAQTTVMRPAVAFVKADRDTLHIKQLFADSAVHDYDMTSIITNLGALQVDSIRQLAIIGMTPAGDRLVVGGTIGYKDQSSGGHVAYQGLFSLPWPLTTASLQNTIEFLLSASGPQNFRPMGVLSKDGTQWFATLTSASQGSEYLTLYHGHTDGSGTVDSTTYSASELEDGVQMSNLAVDTKTNTVLMVVCDRVTDPSQAVDLGVTFFSWTPGNGNEVQALPLTNIYLNLAANDNYTQYNDNISLTTGYPDSMFGLTVIPKNDGSNVYIGLCTDPNHDNSIQLYSVEYTGSSLSNLTTPELTIPRTAIPTTENFFAGQNCGPYKENIGGGGVMQCANGGDVFVNSIGGDSALFITHESPDDCGSPRNIYSGIWYYDLSTQPNNAVLVYDDSSAQELQPVWVVMPYTIPAAPKIPGIAWQGGAAKSTFATVDTSKDSTITFTAVDTAQISTIIDSAKITGPNASEFTIPANMQSSVTLASTMTQAFPVTFAPVVPPDSARQHLPFISRDQRQRDCRTTLLRKL